MPYWAVPFHQTARAVLVQRVRTQVLVVLGYYPTVAAAAQPPWGGWGARWVTLTAQVPNCRAPGRCSPVALVAGRCLERERQQDCSKIGAEHRVLRLTG